jgi:hypothetical protein
MMRYKTSRNPGRANGDAKMEPLMTPEEVAELLRIDVAVVLRLAERGELPSFLF